MCPYVLPLPHLYCPPSGLYRRYNFMPLARGSAFCGYVSMLGALLAAGTPVRSMMPQVGGLGWCAGGWAGGWGGWVVCSYYECALMFYCARVVEAPPACMCALGGVRHLRRPGLPPTLDREPL